MCKFRLANLAGATNFLAICLAIFLANLSLDVQCRLCSTAFIGCRADSLRTGRLACRVQYFCISDCLHRPIQFFFCFFLPITTPLFVKNLLEYAQAGPRGLYTKPKYDKMVATAYFEQEVAESHPCKFMTL